MCATYYSNLKTKVYAQADIKHDKFKLIIHDKELFECFFSSLKKTDWFKPSISKSQLNLQVGLTCS